MRSQNSVISGRINDSFQIKEVTPLQSEDGSKQGEVTITAKDIILLPFNPDKVDLTGRMPSNEQITG